MEAEHYDDATVTVWSALLLKIEDDSIQGRRSTLTLFHIW